MTKLSCTLPEEYIVDYVLGRLSVHDSGWLEAHLKLCTTCQELVREWCDTLTPSERKAEAPARLGRNLRRKAAYRALRQRFATGMPLQGLSMVAVTALALMLWIGLFRGWYEGTAPGSADPPIPRSQTAKFLSQPGATKLTAYSENEVGDVRGELWLDEVSGDVLLVVSGFGPRRGVDYQVWRLSEDAAQSMGLLEIDDRLGYFYAPGLEMREFDQIIVSEEPKGGSILPTGPEAIRIGLRP